MSSFDMVMFAVIKSLCLTCPGMHIILTRMAHNQEHFWTWLGQARLELMHPLLQTPGACPLHPASLPTHGAAHCLGHLRRHRQILGALVVQLVYSPRPTPRCMDLLPVQALELLRHKALILGECQSVPPALRPVLVSVCFDCTYSFLFLHKDDAIQKYLVMF